MGRPGRAGALGPRRTDAGCGAAAPAGRLTGYRARIDRLALPWAPVDAGRRRGAALLAHPRRPLVADVLLVIVTAGVALADDRWGDSPRHGAGSAVLAVALAVPLLWRRRRPLEVFLAISGLALLEWVLDIPSTGSLAVLLALYSVGAHSRSRTAVVVAAAVAEVGVALAVLRWAPTGRVLTGLLLLTGTVTAAWVMGVYNRTRRAYVASVLERASTAERERDHQALLAAAAERARIARELHDIVAHSISVMVALSDGAAATTGHDPQAAHEAAQQASATGRQALTEMRRLLGVLRDRDDVELAPQPGVAQLDDLLAQVRSAGLTVQLVELGPPPVLLPGAQLAVYRLVQESLTNVLKHGRAVTRATVTLRYGPSTVDVTVEDDGAPTAPGRAGGHGLTGMRERLAVFGGTLDAGAGADGGWRVAGRLRLDSSSPVGAERA